MSKTSKCFLYDMAIVGLIIMGVCALGGLASADISAVLCGILALASFSLARAFFVAEKRIRSKKSPKSAVILQESTHCTQVA